MEANNWPEFNLFNPLERIRGVARFIGKLITPFPNEAPDYMSEHYRGADADGEALEPCNTGAEAMLTRFMKVE